MPRLLSATTILAMAYATCFGCSGPAPTRDRRLLSGSPASIAVQNAWKDILGMKVKLDESADIAAIAAHMEADVNSSYMCRKCFYSYERYLQMKESLLANIQNVIFSHQHSEVRKRTATEMTGCDSEMTPRKVPRLLQNVPKRRLNFSQSNAASPAVVVSVSLVIINLQLWLIE